MQNNIGEINKFIREMLNFDVGKMPPGTTVEEFLGNMYKWDLTQPKNWCRITSCMDSIKQTQEAIETFHKMHKNKDKNSYSNIGDSFSLLLAFGVLNAAYIQIHSIHMLIKIFKLNKGKEKIQKYKEELEIHEMRNKIGAHPTSYQNTTVGSTETFMFKESNLANNPYKILLLTDNNKTEEFNLMEGLIDHVNFCEKLMLELAEKIIITRYKTNEEQKKLKIEELNSCFNK